MHNKRVVVLCSTRFEKLFIKANFLNRNDAEHMIKAKQDLGKLIKKDKLEEYLISRMVRALNK